MIERKNPYLYGMSSRLAGMRWAVSVCALVVGLVCGPYLVRADFGDGFWKDYLTRASNCHNALNDNVPEGTRCLLGDGLKLVLDESLRIADAYGKERLGSHFQIAANLTHSPVSDKIGLQGDVDVVLPFSSSGLVVSRQGVSSFFFQQGVTRSWDGSGLGLFRNDLRHGFVRRFRVSKALDADILGISVFHLFNMERRHRGHGTGGRLYRAVGYRFLPLLYSCYRLASGQHRF